MQQDLESLEPGDRVPRTLNQKLAAYLSKIEECIQSEKVLYYDRDDRSDLNPIYQKIRMDFYPRFSTLIDAVILECSDSFIASEKLDLFFNEIKNKIISELESLSFENPNAIPLNEIAKYLACHCFYDIIFEKLKAAIFLRAVTAVNTNEHSLFHIACEKQNLGLLKLLLEYAKSKDIDYQKIVTPTLIQFLSQDEKKFNLIIKYLESLKTPAISTRGVMGMIALMGASTSPAKKIIITDGNASISHEEFSREIQEEIRPASIVRSSVAISPGGSEAYPTWDILIDKDDPSFFRTVRVFLDKKKAIVPREEVQNATRISKKTKMPPNLNLPLNTKCDQEFIAEITQQRLDAWRKSSTSGRYREQNAVMGDNNANDVAKAAGFIIKGKADWQWCHIIAYSLGGVDGEYPTPSEYDLKGPQRESNLVVGTREANAHMLLVEDLAKKLIQGRIEKIYIRAKPLFVKGLEGKHIADFIEYTLQDSLVNPAHQVTFTFDMLSRRKTALQEPLVIGPIIIKLFHTKAVELATESELPSSSMLSVRASEVIEAGTQLRNFRSLSLTDEKDDTLVDPLTPQRKSQTNSKLRTPVDDPKNFQTPTRTDHGSKPND